jgi:hypothetical protein
MKKLLKKFLTNIGISTFKEGILNLRYWFLTIWKDRDWDDYYITKLLQKKIEHQREYLVKANRHVNVDRDNFWMTVVLNLLERKHEEYYNMEKYKYVVMGDEVFSDYKSDTLDQYIKKYPSAERAAKKKYPKYPHFNDKDALAHFMCHIRQQKADDLIFEILKRHSAEWWD